MKSQFIRNFALGTTAALAVCTSSIAIENVLPASCALLNSKLDTSDGNFRPPYEAIVAAGGRTYFYTAPSVECKTTSIFIIKNNYLAVHKPHQEWFHVIYTAKDGESVEGWVLKRNIKLLKHYGQ